MQGRASGLLLLLLAFFSFSSLTVAKSPTSFCKCTCDGNSTIIALDAPSNSPRDTFSASLEARASKKTCNDCNRQFCLGYPLCQDTKEENVFTTCFQRDSAKDQAVVWIFILSTVGLLSYAGVRPWVEQWTERARQRRNYIPVSAQAGQ